MATMRWSPASPAATCLDYLDGGDVELYTTKREAVPAPGCLALIGLGLFAGGSAGTTAVACTAPTS
jgi:hypothetical protein